MNEFKPILAIETSDELCSAAIMLDKNSFAEFNFQKKFVHSEKLMPMISDMLKNADVKLEEVSQIAVSMGPGSFTGLRIGLTVAKGLAVGKDIPIVPVPTFDALAFQLSSILPNNIKFSIVNNANISEVYFAKYITRGETFEVVSETKLINKSEIELISSPEDLQFGNFPFSEKDFKYASPNAISIAKWAYIFGNDLVTFEHDYLEPNYLKNFVVKEK